MKKKILITGANGFIGSFLVEEALRQGYEVFAAIRKTSNVKYIKNMPVVFVYTDFSNKNNLKNQLTSIGKFDYIIHCAGITKACNKEMFETVNYKYTRNLINVLIKSNLIPTKFVYLSSLAAYGPGDEKSLIPVRSENKPNPVSYYGKSKLKTERYIRSIKNFPYLIFRPTGTYGPREKDYYIIFKNIKNHLELYIGNNEQHLSFIHVEDLSYLIINSLKNNINRKSYFVTDGKNYTAKEFNTIIKTILMKKTISILFPNFLVKNIATINQKIFCTLLKKPPTLNSDKYIELIQKNWLCDSSSIVEDFDFQPKYDLKTGVHKTIEWYKNNKLL